jgi:hypothetical protein
MTFCKMVRGGQPDDEKLLELLTRYCRLSLAWRRHTGFRSYGTNGCNFYPVREAAHKRWWRNDCLDSDIRQKLTAALEAQYEDWEVALIIDPLSR